MIRQNPISYDFATCAQIVLSAAALVLCGMVAGDCFMQGRSDVVQRHHERPIVSEVRP